MKRLLIIMFLVFGYIFSFAQTKTIYTCPMHPQIKMEKPGNCPICGMTLVKKNIKAAPPKVVPKKQVASKEVQQPVKRDMEAKNMDMEMDTAETDLANQIQSKVNVLPGKTVRYDLYVTDTLVNFTGKQKHAYAI